MGDSAIFLLETSCSDFSCVESIPVYLLFCKTHWWVFLMYLAHGSRKQTDKLEPVPHLVRVGESIVALQDVLVNVHVLVGIKQLLAPCRYTTAV